MFYRLVLRNSKRDRRENGLFFSSLLISVIAFYIILSLSYQDVMVFLARMESDAVDKLLTMIPVFYAMTLVILFFLVYYAGKFQLERRRHEFGVYLTLGMRRVSLFFMLMAEDLRNSVLSLLMGLPVALLLSELISLVTARLVGLGIIGHQITFSLDAALWTAAGFLVIKSAAFLIFSSRISRQEIGSLLSETPEGAKRQLPAFLYGGAALLGMLCLCAAYTMGIDGEAWHDLRGMALALILGILGTFALFWGFRFLIEFAVRHGKRDRGLRIFNFRQIQETVIRRSGTLAVCSLLILAAMSCFGAGVAISCSFGDGRHVLDYTFERGGEIKDATQIRQILEDYGLDAYFADLFEMRVGHVRRGEEDGEVFRMESVMAALGEMRPSQDRDVLLNNLSYTGYPYLISLSGYNRLLAAAGQPELKLAADEAAVYMDSSFYERAALLDDILETRPGAWLGGEEIYLTGSIQEVNLVTDRSITLSFALILPDEEFAYFTRGDETVYLNGILDRSITGDTSLLRTIADMNERLDEAGVSYESYLQNIGRQLFYMVAASYITIYLAIIFLIIANTIIGVQFLISQQKSGRRYRTLVNLGAGYDTLCVSARKQINWYFGIPAAVAAFGSLFGVRALFTGILGANDNPPEMILVSAAMILALCVVEWIYLTAVKRSSDRYLLTLMEPEREE